jgi:flagellar hook-basal body complex protein FliE
VTEEADLTEVVQAVTSAEVTLQTVVSIRDRLVSAFQEIMRMPI